MSTHHDVMKWARSQKIADARRKLVLLVLATYADEHGVCYPSQQTIGEGAGCHLKTARRHVQALEADGFISREHRYDKAGNRTSDRYQLLTDTAMSPSDELENTAMSRSQATRGQTEVTRGHSEPLGDTVMSLGLRDVQTPLGDTQMSQEHQSKNSQTRTARDTNTRDERLARARTRRRGGSKVLQPQKERPVDEEYEKSVQASRDNLARLRAMADNNSRTNGAA